MLKIFKPNITRSPYQSLAAVLVVSLAFFLVAVFFLIGTGSEKILKFFESKPQVTAFLKDEAKLQEIELLKARIEIMENVKEVIFVSKEEALNIYREQNKDKPLLLEMVTAKILPASLEVSTSDLNSLKGIADLLKKEKIVEDVIYQEDVITALSSWVVTLRKTGLVVGAFLLFVSFLTILIVIGMKISRRKEDIEIFKLLGASSWQIRFPLYLEGIFYGVVSAIISWGLSMGLIFYASPFLETFLADIPLFPLPLDFFLQLLGGLVGMGIVVSFLGSFLAVSRFMKKIR